MKLAPIADTIARRVQRDWNRHCDWDQLREVVDANTGGEYPPMRFDRLTDMVKRRLPEH